MGAARRFQQHAATRTLVNRYLTEFVGTLFLVLAIGLSAQGTPSTAPLAIGLTLSVLVYMGAHVSGAHYNPAVSVAMVLRGHLSITDLAPYVAAQLAAGAGAALLLVVLTGESFVPGPAPTAGPAAVVLSEFLFSFLLVVVILMVATAPTLAGNEFYGAAIGLTVTAGAYAVGPISGAVFNPAVAAGPSMLAAVGGDVVPGAVWAYLVVPVAAGLAAVAAYRAMMGGSGDPA